MIFEKFFHVQIPLIKYQPCAGLELANAQGISESDRGLDFGEKRGLGQHFILTFMMLKGYRKLWNLSGRRMPK